MTHYQLLRDLCAGQLKVDELEYAERVLRDPNDHHAWAVLNVLSSDDREALWARFEFRLKHVFGPLYDFAQLTNPKSGIDSWNFRCRNRVCRELAVNGICTLCDL